MLRSISSTFPKKQHLFFLYIDSIKDLHLNISYQLTFSSTTTTTTATSLPEPEPVNTKTLLHLRNPGHLIRLQNMWMNAKLSMLSLAQTKCICHSKQFRAIRTTSPCLLSIIISTPETGFRNAFLFLI